MDATERFPFEDEAFEYVFSEHMIEHIFFEEADFMLGECLRVLKPGGKIRIATPNLDVMGKLITEPKQEESILYTKTLMERFHDDQLPRDPVFAVNKIFYGFHHRFIHNFSSLEHLLSRNGFTDINKVSVDISQDQHLNGIEQHGKEIGEEINRIETLVIEASKQS